MKLAHKASLGFLGGIAILVLVAANVGDPDRSPAEFQEIGYYQSDSNARIFAIAFADDKNEANIIHHARQLGHTDGQVTAAYYFPEGTNLPPGILILAGTIVRANTVLYEAPGLHPWRYAFLRSPDGSQIFVDCKMQASEDLCRE